MRVLVSAASRHGATAEIAEDIAAALRAAPDSHLEVDVVSAEQVSTVDAYDAFVLGSAVYMGHWLEPARDLVDRHSAVLADRPTWLFSCGPLGDPLKPVEEPVDVAGLVEKTAARAVFAGKLDKHGLGFAERAMVGALRAPQGDFRDRAAIRDWATGIAASVTATHRRG